MLSKLRISYALIVSVAVFFLFLCFVSMESLVVFKSKLYLLNAILLPFIGISIHIKSKADNLASIDGLRSKEMSLVRAHSSDFTRRIWTLWLLFCFTFCCSIIVTLAPLTDQQTFISICFTMSLFSVCFIASTSLYSTDQAIQILVVHLRCRALENAERKSALEQLNANDEFSDEYKNYLNKQRGEN
jgi:hypothetical protein